MSQKRRGPQPPAPRGAPSRLGSLLESARASTLRSGRGHGIDRGVWERTVGSRVAERTDVGALRDGTLTVYAASAAWAQELSYLREDIVARLSAQGHPVRAIRFTVRQVRSELPPLVRRVAAVRGDPAALPVDLQRRLAGIEDPELRAAVAEAAASSLELSAQRSRSRRSKKP